MSQDEVNGDRDPWREKQFWNSTMTTLSYGARDLWKNPRITMIRIEVLVSFVAGVLFLLAIFGSQRRRSRNWLLQKGVFGAFTLSFSVATYILGSMQSSPVKSTMFPIWAVSLIMLHGCTDSVTAYNLDDNKQLTRSLYQAVMYSAYAFFLLISLRTRYTGALFYMVLLAFVRYAQRFAVCRLASNSYNWNKIVADHMYGEQYKDVPVTMENCTYLVEWPVSKSKLDAPIYATRSTVQSPDEEHEVVDIGEIWRCRDKSLGPELKDACLSFSLFHLLRRRYFGFACDESKDRAHDFVFKGLLSDYNRVFKVLEVELAYTYDFFFTKYAVIYYGSMAATIWSLISVIGLSITACITAVTSHVISRGRDDVVITLVILVSTALLEFLQLLFYWMGIWGRVSFVCQSIREQARFKRSKASTGGSCFLKIGVCLASYIMGLREFLANIGVKFAPYQHYWQHKLGQYSLLDSVSHNPNPSKHGSACRLFISCLMGRVVKFFQLMDARFFHQTNVQALRVRKKAGKSVELPDEVKKAVIWSLQITDGKLSNGRFSLQFNRAEHLLWACVWEMHQDPSWSQRKQNQTHIILTWHIATWYCEMLKLSQVAAPEVKESFNVATKLSKYCAYLVVSAPKLLPGHHYDTRSKFDAAAVDAVTFLEKSTNKYQDMKSLTLPQETKTIFESGVKLGRQLEEMKEGTRWQVMADFWAEMILYVAPSDNVNGHIEQLARGGEFITHLWALLSHAGILERDHPSHRVDSFVSAASGFCQCECV